MQTPLLPQQQDFQSLLGQLDDLAGSVETDDRWPATQFELLAEAGVLGWVVPQLYGGSEISPAQLTAGYEQLAASCLTTTFVLTQRNGACQRIAGSENVELKSELLPPACRGETFATVGISHLTTSRQHLKKPAVQARPTDSGYVFSGMVPWVTGAFYADWILTGGTLDDGRQLLVALPTDASGVERLDPPKLLALNSSWTGSVRLDDVQIDRHRVVAGPVEGVMKQGQGGGAGSLTTSALAVGAAAASLNRLGEEATRRADLVEIHEPLAGEYAQIRADLYAAAAGGSDGQNPCVSAESIRRRANSLVLRSAQAHLAACKGAGFVRGHPAERAVREAMFFLVWSCPQPVLTAALREFACVLEP